MVKLHGAVWAVFGVFIWAYTAYIEYKVDDAGSLYLFKWIAVLFLVWGSIRIFLDFIVYKEKKEKYGPPITPTQNPAQKHQMQGSPHQTHQHVRNPHGSPHQTHQHVQPHTHPSHQQALARCSSCHKTLPARAHYCPHCHARR